MTDISLKSLSSFSHHLSGFDRSDDVDDADADLNSSYDDIDARQFFVDESGGTVRHPLQWTCEEVLRWACSLYPGCSLERFGHLRGCDLVAMSLEDFEAKDPHNGSQLYSHLKNLIQDLKIDSIFREFSDDLDLGSISSVQFSTTNELSDLKSFNQSAADFSQRSVPSNEPQNVNKFSLDRTELRQDVTMMDSTTGHLEKDTNKTYTNLLTWSGGTVVDTVGQNRVPLDPLPPDRNHQQPSNPGEPSGAKSAESNFQKKVVGKRKSAKEMSPVKDRTAANLVVKPKNEKIRLCVFMRQLLDNPEYNPSLLKWINREEGIFQIVYGKSKEIAGLWGEAKNNPEMTFEKLGRSLRWCRDKTSEFKKVPLADNIPKKLCFRLRT